MDAKWMGMEVNGNGWMRMDVYGCVRMWADVDATWMGVDVWGWMWMAVDACGCGVEKLCIP
jgi:hypothetical protein